MSSSTLQPNAGAGLDTMTTSTPASASGWALIDRSRRWGSHVLGRRPEIPALCIGAALNIVVLLVFAIIAVDGPFWSVVALSLIIAATSVAARIAVTRYDGDRSLVVGAGEVE